MRRNLTRRSQPVSFSPTPTQNARETCTTATRLSHLLVQVQFASPTKEVKEAKPIGYIDFDALTLDRIAAGPRVPEHKDFFDHATALADPVGSRGRILQLLHMAETTGCPPEMLNANVWLGTLSFMMGQKVEAMAKYRSALQVMCRPQSLPSGMRCDDLCVHGRTHSCAFKAPCPRASFGQRGGGGEGVLDPKLGVPRMA